MRTAVLLVLLAGVAHANGRGPVTNGVYFKPGDAHALYVRSTFGLLISHDDGCTFNWICEDNIGYGGIFDPKYAIGSDGTIFATTFHGLRISRDAGCSFTTATPDEWVDSLDLGPTGDVWIGTATTAATNDVFRSTDNGMTFQPMGRATTTGFYKSLKVAPTDGNRIYVTSNETGATPAMHLFRSDNAGGAWSPEPLAGVTPGGLPLVLVAAVDPANADIVYLISVAASPPAGDILYRSTDGAVTFSPVLTTTSAIRDVVIADAQHVYVTTTIVMPNGNEVGGPAFQSTNAGVAFEALAGAPQLDCLGKRPDGSLAGCAANWGPDFMAVTKSADASCWKKVWRFVNLAGPLACPAGTAEHDVCDVQLWHGIQDQFEPTGPSCVADDEPCAGAVDGAVDGPPGKSGGGCCDGGGPIGLVWAALFVLWLRRRS